VRIQTTVRWWELAGAAGLGLLVWAGGLAKGGRPESIWPILGVLLAFHVVSYLAFFLPVSDAVDRMLRRTLLESEGEPDDRGRHIGVG
jgi:hypothetical protein